MKEKKLRFSQVRMRGKDDSVENSKEFVTPMSTHLKRFTARPEEEIKDAKRFNYARMEN